MDMSHAATSNLAAGAALRRELLPAVVTGQIAGLVMAVVVMAVFTMLGKGPLFPVQVIGSIAFGDAALAGFHLPALLTGLVVHQSAALAWSLVFALVVSRTGARGAGAAAAAGLAVGLASQLVDVNLAMPPIMRALHGHDLWAENVPAHWSWAAHAVFGLTFALYPAVADRLSRRRARRGS
jgi:hypothetical protein